MGLWIFRVHHPVGGGERLCQTDYDQYGAVCSVVPDGDPVLLLWENIEEVDGEVVGS